MGRNVDPKVQQLADIPAFSACSARELERIASLVERVDLPAGDVVVREGRAGHAFYIVLEGEVRVSLGGETVAVLGAGDFFGEMAILEHQLRSATVTTEVPSRLFEVSFPSFHELMRMAPGFAQAVRQARTARTAALRGIAVAR